MLFGYPLDKNELLTSDLLTFKDKFQFYLAYIISLILEI